MPVTKSAEKKVRKDKNRTKFNKKRKEAVKLLIKSVQKKPTLENVKKAYSVIDKLAKVKVIHKNKAARLKSQVARLNKPIAGTISTDKSDKKTRKPKVRSKK